MRSATKIEKRLVHGTLDELLVTAPVLNEEEKWFRRMRTLECVRNTCTIFKIFPRVRMHNSVTVERTAPGCAGNTKEKFWREGGRAKSSGFPPFARLHTGDDIIAAYHGIAFRTKGENAEDRSGLRAMICDDSRGPIISHGLPLIILNCTRRKAA